MKAMVDGWVWRDLNVLIISRACFPATALKTGRLSSIIVPPPTRGVNVAVCWSLLSSNLIPLNMRSVGNMMTVI